MSYFIVHFSSHQREKIGCFQMLEEHMGEDKCSVGTGHRTVLDGATLDSLSNVVGSPQGIFPRKGKLYWSLFQISQNSLAYIAGGYSDVEGGTDSTNSAPILNILKAGIDI